MTTATALPTIAPYVARDRAVSRRGILDECNLAMHHGYGPDAAGLPVAPQAYPLAAYRALLEGLTSRADLDVVTLRDLCATPGVPGRLRLALRHDVDGDIAAALALARLEHEFGVPGSFYMLHTAPYHGRLVAGAFERNLGAITIYREIAALGHEIGLHIDGLTVYQAFRQDGAAAVRGEIGWLRDHGLEIRGTVAHGSKAAFGAENFEIFRGRRRGQARMPNPAEDEPRLMTHAGAPAILGSLDEEALGLDYEGNDIFFQKDVPVAYGATRDVDGWRWNPFLQRWRDDDRDLGPAFCTQEEMLTDIQALPAGTCGVLTVHPCYYGLRMRERAAPFRDAESTGAADRPVHRRLGWRTLEPDAIVARAAGARVSAVRVNRWGMADRPMQPGHGAPRILFVGGGNLDAPGIASPSHLHRQFELRLHHGGATSARCHVLAAEDIGIARAWAWARRGAAEWRPDLLLLALTPEELRCSVPGLWSRAAGFSRSHPPGDYLDWRENALHIVRRSPRWSARQCTPRSLDAGEGRMEGDGPWTVEGLPGRRFLAACYARTATDVRSFGTRCAILVTADGNEADRTAFRTQAADVARAADLPLIDPTPALDGPSRTATRDGAGWTPLGHRVAAQALHELLVAAELLPAPAPRTAAAP